MKKKNALSALGQRERNLVLPLGKKRVLVYEIVSGAGIGLGIVQCSLYPDLAGVFPCLDKAIERAHRIVEFHNRQLSITFGEQIKEE